MVGDNDDSAKGVVDEAVISTISCFKAPVVKPVVFYFIPP